MDTPTTPEPHKPGVKTSEFWSHLALQVVGLGLIAYGAWKQSDGLMEFGAILMGVAGGTYSLSRGVAKRTT